ncbi:hypothetical protein C8J57DRAFT_729358 [Mycena rebaudengoi]|nr:hypothetical protein C8J57DRAFT_729358 [Mycena rebaudengoi]
MASGCPMYDMGPSAFALLSALTGLTLDKLAPDRVENAFLLHSALHPLFAEFRLFLEFSGDQIYIRQRTVPDTASPLPFLAILNDRRQNCQVPNVLLDTPLRLRRDMAIPDIEPTFFVLRKFVGDVVWMCGGAWDGDDEYDDDEEEYLQTLNTLNLGGSHMLTVVAAGVEEGRPTVG